MRTLARLTLTAVILFTFVESAYSQIKSGGFVRPSEASNAKPRLRKSSEDTPKSSKDLATSSTAETAIQSQLTASVEELGSVLVQYWYTDRRQFYIQSTYPNTTIHFKIGQDNTAYSNRGILEFSYDNLNFSREIIMSVMTDAEGNGVSNFYYVAGVLPGQSQMRTCSTNLQYQECLDPELYTIVANDDPNRRVDNPDKAPTATDSNFVVDTGQGLDTQYSYFWGGPLVINIPIKRVVSEDLNADGTLVNPQHLVQNGVVPEFAKLKLSAFDVDYDGNSPPFNPERDRVLFNGVDIGPENSKAYLKGKDMEWSVNELNVPIRLVRFGRTTLLGQPEPGRNTIEIRIDEDNMNNVAGRGQARWSVSIDWAAISFNAMYPVVMVHGNTSCGNFFAGDYNTPCTGERAPEDQWFIRPFKERGILFDHSINMPVESISKHAEWLSGSIPGIATKFGVKHVHIVAHSKGGLDVREYLTRIPPGTLGVLSLTTLSTPHLGSVGADYQLDASEGASANDRFSVTDGLYETAAFSDNQLRTAIAFAVPPGRGTANLRVRTAERFNEKNLPLLPRSFTIDGETDEMRYYAISADANLDDSNEDNSTKPKVPFVGFEYPWRPTITHAEADGLPWIKIPGAGEFPVGKDFVYQEIYRLLGTVHSTRLVPITGGPFPIRYGVKEESGGITSLAFLTNDFAVTEVSATKGPVIIFSFVGSIFERIQAVKANHATLSSPSTARTVLEFIKTAQPVR